MLSGTCAFCGNKTHFTARVGRVIERLPIGDWAYSLEIAATCDACHRFNVARGVRDFRRSLEEGAILMAGQATIEGEDMVIASWSPPPVRPVDLAFIPPGVAGFFKEANEALSIGAYRAVLLLVRSTIEAAAKSAKVTTGSLVTKINKLHEDGHIREAAKEMAHALRILGNDMAHGDIDGVPTKEDAEDSLLIARYILDDIYVADARRAEMLARRKAATATDASI